MKDISQENKQADFLMEKLYKCPLCDKRTLTKIEKIDLISKLALFFFLALLIGLLTGGFYN
jgi:hypothetical protein